MNFRKNAVSYSVWMIFFMCNCAVFTFLCMLCAKMLPLPMPVASCGLVIAFFSALFLVYFLSGRFLRMLHRKRVGVGADVAVRKRLIAEGILVMLMLVMGLVVRILLISEAGESAAYFDTAKVTPEGNFLLVTVQSSVYYYLYLLRGLFRVFGNVWIAGIWLQIVIQLAAGMILYFAVRKLSGACAAIGMLFFYLFSPAGVRAGLNYAPDMLYLLLWSVGLLLIAGFLSNSVQEAKGGIIGSALRWMAALAVGGVTGFLIYVDVTGIALAVPLMLLPMVQREVRKAAVWWSRMVVSLLAAAGGFFGSIWLDGVSSGAGFQGVLQAWAVTFQPETPEFIGLMQGSSPEVLILLILGAINIFSFHRNKKWDRMTVWVLMEIVIAVLYIAGFTPDNMNGRMLLMVLLSVVASVSVVQLFTIAVPVRVAKTETCAVTAADEESKVVVGGTFAENKPFETEGGAAVTASAAAESESAATEVVRKPRFLENPLPLPKKHVKKAMDYAFVPENTKMRYDVEVAESDDFDM